MHVKLTIGLVGTYGMTDFFFVAHSVHSTLDGGSWEYDVNIPYPGTK
jgi:hypothetical protein